MKDSLDQDSDDLFAKEIIQYYMKNKAVFVKRDWLVQQVQSSLDDSSCRFVLISGPPGIGKSTFMAWLAEQDPLKLRYFLRKDSQYRYSGGNITTFLRKIGFQLAECRPELFDQTEFQLLVEQNVQILASGARMTAIEIERLFASPFARTIFRVKQDVSQQEGELKGIVIHHAITDDHLLDEDTLFFLALLGPANILKKKDPHARIVILVDALDELHDRNDNMIRWLARCPELPSNICFILTSRPDDDQVAFFSQCQEHWLKKIPIDPTSHDVRLDLVAYVEKNVAQEPMRSLMPAHNIDVDKFIEQVVTKAEGNFLYLDTLFRAIKSPLANNQEHMIRLLRLEGVPEGLEKLYHFFIASIRNATRYIDATYWDEAALQEKNTPLWEGVIQPMLVILSVAREALSVTQIMRFAALRVRARWFYSALNYIRQFLDEVNTRYFLYHRTFPEFLTSEETQKLYDQFYLDAVEGHRNIVAYYQVKAPSWQGILWEILDEYGIRHLSAHMAGAQMYEALYQLVTGGEEQNRWAVSHTEKEGSYLGYLYDLGFVWEWVLRPDNWNIGRQIRCLLIESSIHTFAGNIVPEFLPALIQHGWSIHAAFAHIPHIPNIRQRTKALCKIAPLLPEALQPAALEIAGTLFHDPSLYEHEQLDLLCTIVQSLPPRLQARLLQEGWNRLQMLSDGKYLLEKIVQLWGLFPPDTQPQAFARIQAMADQPDVINALIRLMPVCRPDQQGEILKRIRAIEDTSVRLTALARLATHLDGDEVTDILRQALAIPRSYTCLAILHALLPHLSGEPKNLAASKAWATIQKTSTTYALRALCQFSAYLLEHHLDEALYLVWQVRPSSVLQLKTLFKLADSLPQPRQNEAKQCVQQLAQRFIDEIPINSPQVHDDLSSLIDLFLYCTAAQKRQIMEAVFRIPDHFKRLWVLLKITETLLLADLPEGFQQLALTSMEFLAQDIGDSGERATMLAIMATYLSGQTQQEALQEAERIVQNMPEQSGTDQVNKALAWLGLVEYLPSERMQMAFIERAIKLISSHFSTRELENMLTHYLPSEVLQKLPFFLEKQPDAQESTQADEHVAHTERFEQAEAPLSPDQKTATILHILEAIREDKRTERFDKTLTTVLHSWQGGTFFETDEHRQLWSKTLKSIAGRERKACIYHVISLLPLINHLGGEMVVSEILQALYNVGRWWP